MMPSLTKWKLINCNHNNLESYSIFNDTTEITLDVMPPADQTAHNTGAFLKRNKNNLLIVTGESWTYGDSLPGVKAAKAKDDFNYRLENIFASRLATILEADLLIKAVPGDDNSNILFYTNQLLKETKDFKYKNVYVVAQITSPGRDHYNYLDLGSDLKEPEFEDWFKLYEKNMIEKYQNLSLSFPDVKFLIWKNFSPLLNEYKDEKNFKIVKKCWMEFIERMHGHKKINYPLNMELYSWDLLRKNCDIFKKIEKKYLAKCIDNDLNCWNESIDYMTNSSLNGIHPTEICHFLWASYLAKESNWIDF